ncbi:OmpH/Skp family outer membrane protein [Bibersteinia trehalosi]|uniref:OmpH family outer membrane protein n=1 Tax=Bibersteinia trehalosi TaxID=47735 RepID=UPI002D7A1B1C|nr:OmpH family outer membrane protein [Bibersteinia trehalosi]
MKKLFKLAAISSALAFGANIAQASDKIGFVNSGFLVQNHPIAVEAEQKFAAFMQENQSKFEAESKALAEEEQSLIAERDKINAKDRALAEEGQKFEAEVQKFQKDQTALESAIKSKIAELDKNTRLSTKQKNAELEKALGKRMKDIENRGKALQKRQADFAKKAEPFQKEAADFQKKGEAFEQKALAFQERIEQANKDAGGLSPVEVRQNVAKSIDNAIKKIAKDKGYTIVLPLEASAPIYLADEKADLTEAVFLEVGGKLPLEQPKAEESKAEETKPEEAKK